MENPFHKLEGQVIPLSEYMTQALGYYYRTQTALGAEGDFITAPEVSQMFGEMLGIWFLNYFENHSPAGPFPWVELGPGRGHLMGDIKRTLMIRPQMLDHARWHALEIHPEFRLLQAQGIAPTPLQHHKTLEDLLTAITPLPLYGIANEFLDTYPIQQYHYSGGNWAKRAVKIEAGQCTWTTLPGTPENTFDYPAPQEGDILEEAPTLWQDYKKLCDYIQTHGGAFIFIDYGYDSFAYGDTFQALRAHQYINPLENPGMCDLTAHVNFRALLKLTPPALQTTLATQRNFLTHMGIELRMEQLCAKNPARREELTAQVERLLRPDQMGNLFKVLIVSNPKIPYRNPGIVN